MTWLQTYDPLHNVALSTAVAALPIVVLLSAIGVFKVRIHFAALLGLAIALTIAIFAFGMPAKASAATAVYGGAFGLFPIGWIILNLIFLYQFTVDRGLVSLLRDSLARITPDPRIQVILVAFSFGAFFEGAAGFGTPVAVTSAILIQLGFRPLQACGLSLIANTAPVAFGALGTPIIALSKVTGIDEFALSKMVGRQLPFFSLIIPFWVVWAMAGLRSMIQIWPAALVAGVAFAIPQFLVSNFVGPMLVDIVASVSSLVALVALLKFWRPIENTVNAFGRATEKLALRSACMPWVILTLILLVWGVPIVKSSLDKISAPNFRIAALHMVVVRAPPVVATPTPEHPTKPESAVFTLNWLSATDTGILLAVIIAGLLMRFSPAEMVGAYLKTIFRVRFSLLTIAAMLALGYVTRYSGADATLGLALAKTGNLYPFFGTFVGWLGVALTGSDTSSNVLFGGMQKITAGQLGLSPTLMAAANSPGGVMGKMVDAQSIVVASTATNWYGHEGTILRYVFFHSVALAALVGILVSLQAYVFPFTEIAGK
jgi:L-lactate transport